MAEFVSHRKQRLRSSVVWSDLPEELWYQILSTISDPSDFVRFGSVCKLFQSLVMNQKPNRLLTMKTQPPFLILVKSRGQKEEELDEEDDSGRREYQLAKLYNIKKNKVHNHEFKIPLMCKDRNSAICSSQGWLIYISSIPTNPLQLFNPFTGKSIKIPCSRPAHFKKVILSCDPTTSPDDFVLCAIYSLPGGNIWDTYLGMKKTNQSSWTFSKEKIWDIIFHNGMLYAMDMNDRLLAYDYKSDCEDHFVPPKVIVPRFYNEMWFAFLVETSNGDLLLVGTYLHRWEFRTFKLVDEETRDASCWIEISRLITNDSIFLTNYYFRGTSGSCVPNFKEENYIYFTHSFGDEKALSWEIKHKEIGVFDMNNRVIPLKSLQAGDQDYPLPLIWINPNLY